jgi:hypothetical protein
MVTQEVTKYFFEPFWDDEYLHLNYVNEPFNDVSAREHWMIAGYPDRFTGDMCDMRSTQPHWNQRFVDIFYAMGWKDIGTSYYKMNTGTVLPTHQDLYLKYISVFGLQGQEHLIRRAVIFLEDWRPGHYAEYMGEPLVKWEAGTVMEWTYNTPHMAANLGLAPRYTLQITGHV